MAELRAAIDDLDSELIALLADRAGYIDRAAELKPAEGIPANAPARVDAVLANVRALSEQRGFDPDLAAGIWQQFIDWAIAREEHAMASSPEK